MSPQMLIMKKTAVKKKMTKFVFTVEASNPSKAPSLWADHLKVKTDDMAEWKMSNKQMRFFCYCEPNMCTTAHMVLLVGTTASKFQHVWSRLCVNNSLVVEAMKSILVFLQASHEHPDEVILNIYHSAVTTTSQPVAFLLFLLFLHVVHM